MKKSLYLFTIVILLTACTSSPEPPKSPESPPVLQQFHWQGEVLVDTADLLETSNLLYYTAIRQLPFECQKESVHGNSRIYFRDVRSHLQNWYHWEIDSEELSITLESGNLYTPNGHTNAYVKPVLSDNQIIPKVVVSTNHPEIKEATATKALENTYWGIIIQLDLPNQATLTGNLPLQTSIPVECWAGSYGGQTSTP